MIGTAPLPRKFYQPSARVVAPRLLGHYLAGRNGGKICGGLIVEVEAYLRNDPAAHSYIGMTPRNRVMWGPPGHWYVYFIYGNHYCVNVVCRQAEAVLIRAIEPEFGIEEMSIHRGGVEPMQLTNGPGKLCEAMGIDRRLDGVDLCDRGSPLVILRNPAHAAFLRRNGPIRATTRIGLTKAATLPLRFVLEASSYLSRRPRKAKHVGSLRVTDRSQPE